MLAPCPVCLPLQIGQAGCAGDISVPHQSLSLCAPAAGSDIPCARTPPGTASPTTPSPVSHWNGRELPRHLLPQWEKPLFIHPESPESHSPAPEPALGHRGTLSRARRDFTPKLMQPISSLCLQDNQSSGTGSTGLLKHQIPPFTPFQGAPNPPCPCWVPGSAQDVPLLCGLSRYGITHPSAAAGQGRAGLSTLVTSSPPGAGRSLAKEGGGTWPGLAAQAPQCPLPALSPEGGQVPALSSLPGFGQQCWQSGCRGLNAAPAGGHRAAAMATGFPAHGAHQHCLPTSVTSAGTSLEQSSPELRALEELTWGHQSKGKGLCHNSPIWKGSYESWQPLTWNSSLCSRL